MTPPSSLTNVTGRVIEPDAARASSRWTIGSKRSSCATPCVAGPGIAREHRVAKPVMLPAVGDGDRHLGLAGRIGSMQTWPMITDRPSAPAPSATMPFAMLVIGTAEESRRAVGDAWRCAVEPRLPRVARQLRIERARGLRDRWQRSVGSGTASASTHLSWPQLTPDDAIRHQVRMAR